MNQRPYATVGGLIVASDGEILLVRSKKWKDLYTLPGGKIEWGETCEAAFIREVWEETQLKIVNIRFAIVQDCIFSPDFFESKHFIMHDYIADLDPGYSKQSVKLNDEGYEFLWINPQNALNLPMPKECRILIEWHLKHSQKETIIGIDHYKITCIIGINPEEKLKEQNLYVDLKVGKKFEGNGSEKIEDTIDYRQLASLCSNLASKNYKLIETFGEDILEECFRNFGVNWGWVRIKKPSAIPGANFAFVEFTREK